MSKFKVGDVVSSKINPDDHSYGIVVYVISDIGRIKVSWRDFDQGHNCGCLKLPFGNLSGWNYDEDCLVLLKSNTKQMEFNFDE